jgi:hypothetical protein
MNQLLLEHLDPRAWRAQLPGSKVRTIAAIFAHVHNIRCKWLRWSAPHLKLPPRLDRTRCTHREARQALAESEALCSQMLSDALAAPYVSSLNLVDASVYRRRQTRRLIVKTMSAISIVATRRTG